MLMFSVFEGWFPILTIMALEYITPIYAYAFTLLFAVLIFLSLVVIRGKVHEFCNREAYKDLLLTAFFITTMFACIYIGLSYTSAGNMAVIIFLQLFFSFLYFNLFGKEPFAGIHLLGALLMGIGGMVILFPEELILNKGDLLVLLAAAIAPVANRYQKKARRKVSSETILAFRSIIAIPFLFLLAWTLETKPSLGNIQDALVFIALNGLLIMGLSKIFWVEAIYRISITKASALAALIPVFTIIFAYFTLGETPTTAQLMGIIPVLAGGFLITRRVSTG
jgi:drug/metabolite transporter (DMT)-like permease